MKMCEIGKVTKPQGFNGELRVQMFDASFFDNLKEVYLKNQKYSVLRCVTKTNGFASIKLKGVETLAQAENFRNFNLSAQVELKENELLTDEIIGFDVCDSKGKKLDVLLEVNNYGSADIFECANKLSFPYTDEFVINIDYKNKQIIVDEQMLEEESVKEESIK
ncbi:MAG: ribosome maturation factor RimM [Firmicutes bacterium]|nr:ribosome maturation factor RimM [Bacillota bacterium]